jgi:filamentous hemagglutinin family protein
MLQTSNQKFRILRLLNAFIIVWIAIFSGDAAFGQQLQPDDTLGSESSVVTSGVTINNIPSDLVTNGAIRGANLFHSFATFNVNEGQGVYFDNPGIERIITRITGSSPSNIFGTLGVLGETADLFLLNPNGIIFGPNASLDLKGSFLATTASGYIFPDGIYSAVEPSSSTLLSVNMPIGLQFRGMAGPIVNQSRVIDPISGLPVGLQVQRGKTLALVGGDITMEGGILTASGGRIELGSISGSDQVSLNGKNLALGYKGIQDQDFGDIKLLREAAIVNGGDIRLQGRNVTITEGSQLFAIVLSGLKSSSVKINASESFELSDKSFITTSTVGDGKAGNVIINAKRIFLRDSSFIESSSSFFGATNASGQAGNILITSGQIEISGGSYINASTTGPGEGGNIVINASDYVNIFGVSPETGISSGLYTLSEGNASGNAGSITLNTPFMRVADGATLNVSSFGTGAAGNLNITAQYVLLENNGSFSAQTTGEAGNITLNANDIILRSNSIISTNATDTADGGNITINTGVLLGADNSDIIANASGGSGGRINITAKGIFGFQTLTRDELQQLEPTQSDPGLLLSSDITAISQSDPSLNGQVTLNTTEPDPSEGLVELPTTVLDPSALVAQNACKRGSESEFTSSGRGGLPANPNQDLSNGSAQIGLVEPTSAAPKVQTQNQSPTISVTPPQAPAKMIAPAQGWVYNEKGEIVLVAYNPSATSPQRLKDNTACAAQ